MDVFLQARFHTPNAIGKTTQGVISMNEIIIIPQSGIPNPLVPKTYYIICEDVVDNEISPWSIRWYENETTYQLSYNDVSQEWIFRRLIAPNNWHFTDEIGRASCR